MFIKLPRVCKNQDELLPWIDEFTYNSDQVSSRNIRVFYRGEISFSFNLTYILLYKD